MINAIGLHSSNQIGLQTASQRLTSGLRINGASDDAAGLAISSLLGRQVIGESQAISNVSDGISLIQVQSSVLQSADQLYDRARELALSASNGTLSDNDRVSLNEEYQQIMTQVDDMFSSSIYNGNRLFHNGGVVTVVSIQDGDAPGDSVALSSVDYSTISSSSLPADISSQANAQTAIGAIDGAMGNLNIASAKLGADENSLVISRSYLESSVIETQIAKSRITDADYAKETTELAKYQLLESASFILQKKIVQSKAAMVYLLQQ